MIPKFRAFIKLENAVNPMQTVAKINFEKESVTIEQGLVFKFNNIELMQYTGTKDKSGAEVYFNDIVEDEYGHRYEVVFEGDCLRCNGISRIRGGHKPKNRWFGRGLKIIGNIYENPELLEVTE